MMKSLIIAFVSLLAGLVAGWFSHAWLSDARAEIRATMQRTLAGSCHATIVSLAALTALERGDSSGAKHRLAHQIASYQHTFGNYDGVLPDCPKLRPLIATTAEQSETLREELAKKESQQ